MPNHAAESTVNVALKDLDKLIRRAVHDEITKIIKRQPNVFYLEPRTPLYEDMAEIARMKRRRKIKIRAREEAFGG